MSTIVVISQDSGLFISLRSNGILCLYFLCRWMVSSHPSPSFTPLQRTLWSGHVALWNLVPYMRHPDRIFSNHIISFSLLTFPISTHENCFQMYKHSFPFWNFISIKQRLSVEQLLPQINDCWLSALKHRRLSSFDSCILFLSKSLSS